MTPGSEPLHPDHGDRSTAGGSKVALPLDYASEVAAARDAGRPLVALESTVIAHGLPRPHNLRAAQGMESEVRTHGATPATIAVLGGRIKIGLSAPELAQVAYADDFHKVSRRDYPNVVARRLNGATTVAATMMAAHWAGIEVFATGGIGGIHRGAGWDVSADLPELARTPVVVVCAGAKAILDLPATLEWLETHGVPVVGYGTDEWPAFYSRQSGLRLELRADQPGDVADLVRAQRALGLTSGILVAVPAPADAALPAPEVEAAIETALRQAAADGIRGKAATPYLLEKVTMLTGGASLQANIALLHNNARVGAQIARALRARPSG